MPDGAHRPDPRRRLSPVGSPGAVLADVEDLLSRHQDLPGTPCTLVIGAGWILGVVYYGRFVSICESLHIHVMLPMALLPFLFFGVLPHALTWPISQIARYRGRCLAREFDLRFPSGPRRTDALRILASMGRHGNESHDHFFRLLRPEIRRLGGPPPIDDAPTLSPLIECRLRPILTGLAGRLRFLEDHELAWLFGPPLGVLAVIAVVVPEGEAAIWVASGFFLLWVCWLDELARTSLTRRWVDAARARFDRAFPSGDAGRVEALAAVATWPRLGKVIATERAGVP